MSVDEFTESVRGVPVVRWNPSRGEGRAARPVDNFGDLIGPIVVEALLSERLGAPKRSRAKKVADAVADPGRLVAVGSILQFAEAGDTVWGTGVNAKVQGSRIGSRDLDVRAVRGPFTRLLLEAQGIAAPDVFGDPGLLLPALREVAPGAPCDVLVIPNLNDLDEYTGDDRVLSPQAKLDEILAAIAAASFVTGSSLHAMVLADALGVPSRPMVSGAEHPLKYADYYAGTGRLDVVAAASVDEAIALGPVPPAVWDADALRAAFPADLWSPDHVFHEEPIRPLAALVADVAALLAPAAEAGADAAPTVRAAVAELVLEQVLAAAFRLRAHRVTEADLAEAVALGAPLANDPRMPRTVLDDPVIDALAHGEVREVRLAALHRDKGLRADAVDLLFAEPRWRLRGTVFDARRPLSALLRVRTPDGTLVEESPLIVSRERDWRGAWSWEALVGPKALMQADGRATVEVVIPGTGRRSDVAARSGLPFRGHDVEGGTLLIERTKNGALAFTPKRGK